MTDRIRVVVTVKAYPQVSAHRGEVVCVAGLRLQQGRAPEWVRLFPFDFRRLDAPLKFKKWDVIDVDVERPRSDDRPESWEPDAGSIEIIDHLETRRRWADRWSVIGDIDTITTCGLYARQRSDRTSLGIVKPHTVEGFSWESIPDAEQRQTKADIVSGPDLLTPDRVPLEVIPWRFKYEYHWPNPGAAVIPSRSSTGRSTRPTDRGDGNTGSRRSSSGYARSG